METVRSFWLEFAITALVAIGVVILGQADEASGVDVVLGIGVLGTLLVATGSLALGRRQAADVNRPFIGTVNAKFDAWDNATRKGNIAFEIKNTGNVPGRVTSHLTAVNDLNPQPTSCTKRDFLFPGDSIRSGWPVAGGDKLIKRIRYEAINGRRKYDYTVEYYVAVRVDGSATLEIVERDGT